MCDTLLAPPGSTAQHVMLFGKNSDRQRNEAQVVESFPARAHAQDTALACTYIVIPQVKHTHAVLLCRPFWIWGAEMGVNEHGVAIGNEAVHARQPASQTKSLIGMDLLRLALERSASAEEAVSVITSLLKKHGQGGNSGHLTPSYYNNSFLIADGRQAFILETVGREWLMERVQTIQAISNTYSIDTHPDRMSIGLPDLIRAWGWDDSRDSGLSRVIADPHKEHIGNAQGRRATSRSLLAQAEGHLTVSDMMAILRDHGPGERRHPEWRPEYSGTRTVCMHGGTASQAGQTVGSMICDLTPGHCVHWVTATAAPCTGIFKPVLLDVPLPPHGARPTDRYDPYSLWWKHERLHRTALLGNFSAFLKEIQPEREELEARFRLRLDAVRDGGTQTDRARVVAECWKEAADVEEEWVSRVDDSEPVAPPAITSAWKDMNALAGMELFGDNSGNSSQAR